MNKSISRSIAATLKSLAENDDNYRRGMRNYPEDIPVLQRTAELAGYRLTPRDAAIVWAAYSGMMCAGWITLEGLSAHTIANIIDRTITIAQTRRT